MLPQGLYWLFFTLLPSLVLGLPWDAINGRSAMGSMVTGAAPLEGIGPLRQNQVPHNRHLGIRGGHDALGNLTILVHQLTPPHFIINRRQLYYYMNSTTVFPVNVVNTTLPDRPPLQLIVGKKREGLKGGSWRFAGSMLYYDYPGNAGSQGIFWSCQMPGQTGPWPGVFLFAPKEENYVNDCNSLTFHNFGNTD
ncbi:hypothetical protein CC2G_006247 [Coprinopsis cinerea AmutBmut pab1-1]|nr:hypothetical protein CC2G_006247 [Coprinopsis cinerea AmutBmut pab1-1]